MCTWLTVYGTRAYDCWGMILIRTCLRKIQKGKRNDNKKKKKKKGFLVRLGGLSRLTEAKVPITIATRWLVSQKRGRRCGWRGLQEVVWNH